MAKNFFFPGQDGVVGLGRGRGQPLGLGGLGVCCLPGGPSLPPALEALEDACGAARGGLTRSHGWREGTAVSPAPRSFPWTLIFP